MGLMKEAMGLGTGSVDRILHFREMVGGSAFHRVEEAILRIHAGGDEVRFDQATATETPRGADDFFAKEFFHCANGGQITVDRDVQRVIGVFFAGADEVAREQTKNEGIFSGFGLTVFGTGSGRVLGVGGVGYCLCGAGHR